MQNTHGAALAIDALTMTRLVRQVLGRDDTELVGWQHHQFQSLLGPAALSKVFRLSGTARVGGETRPWSLILKALTRPADPAPAGWDREILAFRSGLLDDLPAGLVAPRCFAIEERADAVWLWQEDVAEQPEVRWPIARFALAARHLGRFSGRSLVAGQLPEAPWLSRDVLRERANGNAAFWAGQAPIADQALLDRMFPDGLLDRARRVWEERHLLLAALDRLPQTLVHGDADRRNFFARRDANGADVTAAIDWAWLGVGALGEDLVNLIAGSTLWFQAEPRELPDLTEACLESFEAGLADAGAADDARWASVGFAVGAALRYGPLGPFAAMVQYPAMGRAIAQASGYTLEELADRMAIVQRFAYDQLDAVRDDLAVL